LMNAPPIISSSHSKQTDQAMQEEEVSVAPVKLQIRPVQNKPTAKVKLNAAIQAAKSGDIDAAKKQLKKLIGGEFDRQARIQLLALLSKQSDGQGFPGLLSDSLQKYPQDRVFLLYEANRLFAQKQYLTLIEKFKTHTQNTELLSLLATSYQRTNQHELAADHFISALKINPQQPRLWISLAISQQNLLQREPALNSYQMALRSGPMNQRLHDFVQAKIKQLSN
jgi:tetratricopeptide (TPR) repeat protein